VDRNFDKLEIYVLRNVLHVDEELVPWVRLGHYEVNIHEERLDGLEC
jgi:kinetochore protein Mis12/MTW1